MLYCNYGERASPFPAKKITIIESKFTEKISHALKIHYACIGAIDIPDFDAIPDNEVKVHTRQGVDILFNSRECVAV